jgi:hypothetical protein
VVVSTCANTGSATDAAAVTGSGAAPVPGVAVGCCAGTSSMLVVETVVAEPVS